MSEEPIWNQARAMASDFSAGRYTIRGKDVRFVQGKDFLKKIDPLQKEAERILIPFAVSYYSGDEPQDFTKVREYTNENNAFDILGDPLAPSSVVVVKYFQRDPDTSRETKDVHDSIYWVSSQKWPGLKLPFVYQFTSWPQTTDQGHFVIPNPKVNSLDWNDPMMLKDIPYLFSCAWPDIQREDGSIVRYGRSEIDIWHKGSTRPDRRNKEVDKTRPIRSLSPAPSGI